MNRKDFRPNNNYSKGISSKDSNTLHNRSVNHKIANSKKLQSHISLEHKYSLLHEKYRKAKTENEKIKHAKAIKQLHQKVHKSRVSVYQNKEHHDVLKKLHSTKDNQDLHKDINIDKSRHEIVNDTSEVEHKKLIAHVVAPVESHVLQDIGRGLKSVAIGVGQVGAVGLNKLGEKIQQKAKELSTPTPTATT